MPRKEPERIHRDISKQLAEKKLTDDAFESLEAKGVRVEKKNRQTRGKGIYRKRHSGWHKGK